MEKQADNSRAYPRVRRSRHLLPILALSVLAALIMLPSWELGGSVIASAESDVWAHLWGYWWIGESILQDGSIPFETDLIRYPRGGHLYFPDMLGALLSLPLQPLFSIETVFNLVLIIKVFLLGLAVYCLCFSITRDRRAAFLAGLCFQASPFFLAEIHNGISEVLNFSWSVFFICALVHIKNGRRYAAIAGAVFFFLTFLGNWYYALINIMCAGMWLCGALLSGISGRTKALLRTCTLVLLAMLLAAGLTYPLAATLRETLRGEAAIVIRDHDEVRSLFENEHNVVDILTYVVPGNYHSPDLKEKFNEDFLHVNYCGLLILASAAAGFALCRRRAGLEWGITLAVFFILSLGPFLYLNNQFIRWNGQVIKLPFHYLFEYLPPFGMLGHPQRLAPYVILALLVYASLAWRRLLKKIRFSRSCAVLLGLGLLAESLLFSPAPYPVANASFTIDPYLAAMNTEQNAGAVIDLPARFTPYWLNNRYFYFQIHHGLPITYTVNSPSTTLKSSLAANPLVDAILNIEFEDGYAPGRGTTPEVRTGVEKLTQAGFSHVIVHRDFYSDERFLRQTIELLDTALGEPAYTSDRIIVYRLPERVVSESIDP